MESRSRTWATTLAVVLSLTLAGATSASASTSSDGAVSPEGQDTITLELGGASSAETESVLTVDVTGLDAAEIAETEQMLQSTIQDSEGITAGTTGSSPSPLLAPRAIVQPVGIRCDRDQTYTDTNNSLNIQNNCRYDRVNWGITLSSSLRSIINSPVNELGAKGYRNGTFISMNAPHLGVSKTYWFHGGFKMTSVPATFKITDNFEFTVKSGGKTLPASLYVCKTVSLKP